MLVSSPSILMRSCQRAAKIVQLLHLLPNTEIKDQSVSIINKTRELLQSKQPSLKFRLHPEFHESVSNCCKSAWLITSSLHLNETLMLFQQPEDLWVGLIQGNTADLHSWVESCVEETSAQGPQQVLLQARLEDDLLLILPTFYSHTWPVAGAMPSAKTGRKDRKIHNSTAWGVFVFAVLKNSLCQIRREMRL